MRIKTSYKAAKLIQSLLEQELEAWDETKPMTEKMVKEFEYLKFMEEHYRDIVKITKKYRDEHFAKQRELEKTKSQTTSDIKDPT